MNEELIQLLSDLAEIDSEVKALEHTASEKRIRIHEIALELGGAVKVDGVADVRIMPASTSHSYDTKALDKMIQQMIEDGELYTAKRIMATKKETTRKESLRIMPYKLR